MLKFTLIALFGYGLRTLLLFYLGGLVAFLHKDEHSPFKLFQLGIVAPALITAFINGKNIETPESPTNIGQNIYHAERITSPAPAPPPASSVRDTIQIGAVKTFRLLQETPSQQLLRGLIDSKPKKVWFVIAGSHVERETAEQQAKEIRVKGFPAEV